MNETQTFVIDQFRQVFLPNPPARLGLAVSGGGDSMAMLQAAARAFDGYDTELFAVTVDHGLRAEAAGEIALVSEAARALSIPHDVLVWDGWDQQGNLQDAARQARYALMTAWARKREITVLALGHTQDDQAETMVMRLVRASGVDGLSGIPRRRVQDGVTLVRPLLDLSRGSLRRFLCDLNLCWAEDPSNEDTRFDRVRIRNLMPQLTELGLTPAVLSDIAGNMTRAREALSWYTFLAAREMVQLDAGDVLIATREFRTLPDEIARRLLVAALRWIGASAYPPRRAAVNEAIQAAKAGRTTTLHGCLLLSHAGLIWICREYNAVRGIEAAPGTIWDNRWRISSGDPLAPELRLRALGPEALAQCPDWRQTGRPMDALTASPSIWQGDRVIAAPLAGLNTDFEIELIGGGEDFYASILSH